MKLKDYFKNLEDLIKENPKALDMTVITSIDAEGNGYNKIYKKPSLGIIDDGDFMKLEDIEKIHENDILVVLVN